MHRLRIQIQKLIDYITAYFKPEPEGEEDMGIEMQSVIQEELLGGLKDDLHDVEGQLSTPDTDANPARAYCLINRCYPIAS